MGKFGGFCKIASSFSDIADFLTVYIEEAHPDDGWAFKNNIKINTHRDIEDRIEAAKHLLTKKKKYTAGMAVKVNTRDGARDAVVIKAGKFNVDIDMNHPLAGKTVTFDITIEEVRDAAPEEISHGHAH